MKHTPGPWRYEVGSASVRDSRNHCMFTAKTWATGGTYDAANNDAASANLRLIAAAPDLLAALQEIASMGESCECICGPEAPADHWTACPHAYAVRARAAIAQATGE